MKNLNPEVLGTTYGELVIDLTKHFIITVESIADANSVVSLAVGYADELVRQLVDREAQAKAYAESTRIVYPVDWAPDANDDANRSGQHWSQPETDALIAQFKNGKTGSEIAVYHRRTWTAVSAQLAKYGLLSQEGRGFYVRADGSAWEL